MSDAQNSGPTVVRRGDPTRRDRMQVPRTAVRGQREPSLLTADASPAPRVPVGRLRRAVIPSRLQWIGYQATTVAIVGLVAMPFMTWAFESLRINIDQHTGVVLGAHALGPAYFVFGLVMALLMPWRALPWTPESNADVGAFGWRVRAELHKPALYRAGGYVPRLTVVAVLWLGLIALFAATSPPPVGWIAGAGTPVTWVLLVAGFVFSVLALPVGGTHQVMVDDDGNLFAEDGSSIDG